MIYVNLMIGIYTSLARQPGEKLKSLVLFRKCLMDDHEQVT